MQIELDHHPEPEPRPEAPAPAAANPYRAPAAPLIMPSAPSAALWNPNAAANWSLLFTPAFGSYLHYLNWQALGDEGRAGRARGWFIASLVILGLLPFLRLVVSDPQVAESAPRGIAFWYLILWYFAAARSQAKFVKEDLDGTYERRSWGMPLLAALGGILAYFVYCFIVAMALVAFR